jgi:hypothetical protein
MPGNCRAGEQRAVKAQLALGDSVASRATGKEKGTPSFTLRACALDLPGGSGTDALCRGFAWLTLRISRCVPERSRRR